MKTILRRSNLWLVLIVVVYGVVYASSLTFVYTEGDDAASIAYHITQIIMDTFIAHAFRKRSEAKADVALGKGGLTTT